MRAVGSRDRHIFAALGLTIDELALLVAEMIIARLLKRGRVWAGVYPEVRVGRRIEDLLFFRVTRFGE